ncbi:glycosyltransferase [Candidatus Methylocalor cossyra]|uniref:Glycosyltransferase 2-like domain-containing protein n=1 Tax=Candidatus Methylocalor cossyra TaxID=3108543 RepID=A0ABM9NFE9_9GAMM
MLAEIPSLLFLPLTLAALWVLSYDLRDFRQRLRRIEARGPAADAAPRAAGTAPVAVDVVIPVYNMGATFERTLASVERSTYPRRRLIVVDDGSDDGRTWPLLQSLRQRIDRLERIPHGGKAAAANYGASLGDGAVILILDADSQVVPDFIEQALAELTDGIDGVDFVQQVANPEASWWTRWADFERRLLALAPDNFGALFAVRRAYFQKAPFQTCLAPQFEINQRLRALGRLKISPRPLVYSDEPATLGRTYRRKRRWVYGLLETQRRHRRPWDHHILVPFLDLALVNLLWLAPLLPWLALFPAALVLGWCGKSWILGRRLGVAPPVALTYPVFMLMLCLAAVDATLRFLRGRTVSWS